MADQAKRVVVAANPKSGAQSSAEKVESLRTRANERGFECEVIYSLEQVQQKSSQYMADGSLKAVVAAGGDGTADALANLLEPATPILLLPMGTENLLAKHWSITGDVSQSIACLEAGHLTKMDVGNANGTLFLVMLSCGFDAQVVREMDAVRKGHITRWSYSKPIWNSLNKYRFPRLSVIPSDDPLVMESAWIFVFNVPRYAAGLDFCPQADPHDGYLDVCTFDKGGVLFGMSYFARLGLRTHQSMNGFEHRLLKSFRIEAESEDTPYQIDGDPGGILPLDIKVEQARLTLLLPPQNGQSL